MALATYYAGFGQLLGTDDDGSQTFVGYGQVHALKKGSTLEIKGEVLIDVNTNYAADHYKTGVSITNVLSVLGLTGTYSLKGDGHNWLSVYDYAGARYTDNYTYYDYTMFLQASANPLFLIVSRYYTTSGDQGGLESSQRGPYVPTNTWVFLFEMVEV
jgi:hypothetical protein